MKNPGIKMPGFFLMLRKRVDEKVILFYYKRKNQ